MLTDMLVRSLPCTDYGDSRGLLDCRTFWRTVEKCIVEPKQMYTGNQIHDHHDSTS